MGVGATAPPHPLILLPRESSTTGSFAKQMTVKRPNEDDDD